MTDADLATRYAAALIAKLEQTQDPMMLAVLTGKIEELIGKPVVRPERTTDPSPQPASPPPAVNLKHRNDNAPPSPVNTAAADENTESPGDNKAEQRPAVKPYAGQLPRGAMQDWLKGKLTAKSNSVYALAQMALKEGLWPVEIPGTTAIARIDAVLRSYEGVRFKKVQVSGDSRIHWTVI